MKKIVVLLIVVGLLGFLVWHGIKTHMAEAPETETAEPAKISKSENGEVSVAMDEETQKRIEMQTSPLSASKLQPSATAYGHVLDPSPLAILDGDLAAARAQEESSRAEAERTASLFQSGQAVSKKIVESTDAQFRADQTKSTALARRMTLEWGSAIAAMPVEERQKLIDRLVKNESALIGVDLPAAEITVEKPASARLTVLGRENQPIAADDVARSASINPKTQSQSFLLRVDTPPFALLPGAAVTAYLELPGEPEAGVIIPRDAVVRVAGSPWVYIKTDDEHFMRREIATTAPVAQGYFQREHFSPDEKVVTTGAQTLLSAEQKTQSAPGD